MPAESGFVSGLQGYPVRCAVVGSRRDPQPRPRHGFAADESQQTQPCSRSSRGRPTRYPCCVARPSGIRYVWSTPKYARNGHWRGAGLSRNGSYADHSRSWFQLDLWVFIFKTDCGTSGKPEELALSTLEGNLDLGAREPGFEDEAGGNPSLKKDSPVFTELPGFTPIPLSKIGLYRDKFRAVLPQRQTSSLSGH